MVKVLNITIGDCNFIFCFAHFFVPASVHFKSCIFVVCYTAVFRVVTQQSSQLTAGLWGEALRDDTKNGCVAD